MGRSIFMCTLVLALCTYMKECHTQEPLHISFHESMRNYGFYRTHWIERNAQWKLAQELYDTYVIHNPTYDYQDLRDLLAAFCN